MPDRDDRAKAKKRGASQKSGEQEAVVVNDLPTYPDSEIRPAEVRVMAIRFNMDGMDSSAYTCYSGRFRCYAWQKFSASP